MPHVMIIDDDSDTREILGALAEGEGFSAWATATIDAALDAMEMQPPDVVLLDADLRDGDRRGLLQALDRLPVPPSVVIVTSQPSVDTAVEALRHGVSDYLAKPLDVNYVRGLLQELSQGGKPTGEHDKLCEELERTGHFLHIVGKSKAIMRLCRLLTRIAPTSASVLISGESGTGKEVVTRTIHDLSQRRDRTFLALNCGAVSPSLMESELFGHERGSFTGADRRHKGCFERASHGTLFLDEITEMPAELQVKLLRVLETGQLTRVGGEAPIDCDVRVLAATNRPVDEALSSGVLREDLYYRLRVFQLDLPPLRERPEDVEPLAQHFLDELSRRDRTRKRFSAATLDRLRAYAWPGNVRELRNAVRASFILSGGLIDVDTLPAEVRENEPARQVDGDVVRIPIGTSVREAERRLVLATLRHHDGNKTTAAQALGISLKTLYNRLNRYDPPVEASSANARPAAPPNPSHEP